MPGFHVQRVNACTTLIDFHLFDIHRIGAVYLVCGAKKCLIDAGTRTGAKRIVQALDSIGAFPPDMVILTHSHFDHTQGVPLLRREAARRGRRLPILAYKKALRNLTDQSWNRVFHHRQTFSGIPDVIPLENGQMVDLGGIELTVVDVAGHCADDIALYDAKHRNLFAGDALGYRIENTVTFPPFMPPFWNPERFLAAVETVKRMDCGQLCLAHFGCLQEKMLEMFLDEIVNTYRIWWEIFAEAETKGGLADIRGLKEQLIRKAGIVLPDLEIAVKYKKVLLLLLNRFHSILGQPPVRIADVQMNSIVDWLAKGYILSANKMDSKNDELEHPNSFSA